MRFCLRPSEKDRLSSQPETAAKQFGHPVALIQNSNHFFDRTALADKDTSLLDKSGHLPFCKVQPSLAAQASLDGLAWQEA